jgi:hypothetical protein
MGLRLWCMGLLIVALWLGSCGPSVLEQGQEQEHAKAPAEASTAFDERALLVPPVYALRFLDHAAQEPIRWEARLLELDSFGRVITWGWRGLVKGDPDPLMVYNTIQREPQADHQSFVEVRQRDGDWMARVEVPSTVGKHIVPIDLTLVQVAVLGGGVIDQEDERLGGVELRLYQLSGSELNPLHDRPHLAWTNEVGEFRFPGVEPGRYYLRVRTEGRPQVAVEIDLEGGVTEGYELRMSSVEKTSELPLAILGVEEGHVPSALLALRSLGDEHVQRIVHTKSKGHPHAQILPSGVGYAAIFPLLPEGSYELNVLGLDSLAYAPAKSVIEFDDLGNGVRIQAQQPAALHSLNFNVSAEGSDKALKGCYLRFSSPDWWAPLGMRYRHTTDGVSLPSGMPIPDWMMGRAGFQPAYGSFAPEGTEPSVVQEAVVLKRGWGCELIFRDGSERLPSPGADSWERTALVHMAPALEGVVVRADGVELGRSDAMGRVRVALPAPPKILTFEKTGWLELPAFLTDFVDAHDRVSMEREGSTVVWFDSAR